MLFLFQFQHMPVDDQLVQGNAVNLQGIIMPLGAWVCFWHNCSLAFYSDFTMVCIPSFHHFHRVHVLVLCVHDMYDLPTAIFRSGCLMAATAQQQRSGSGGLCA